ncbi:MAG: TadE/TadG family type IV pilus assembly protein [Chloroflexota bacterium]
MKPLNSRVHTYAHKTRGQALVEFSLILPILLFVTLGIIDFGRILVMFSGASGAVRDATRQATLAGTVPDTQNGGNAIERYRACGEMYQLATDFNFSEAGTGNVIQFIDILYFDTTEQTTRTNAELVNALDNLNNLDASTPPDGTATLGADFDCNDGADNGWESRYSARDTVDTGQSIQDASAGSLQNGDLIVIVMEVEIDFITPFLSDAFQNLSVTFRSQRSVVTRLQLVTSPNDRDGDSIPDILEWQYFGCLAEENPVGTANVPTTYILPDGKLVVAADTTVGYAYVTGGYPGTVTVDPTASDTQPGSDPGNAQTTAFGHPDDGGNCAIENIPEATLAGGDPAIVPTDQPYECDAGGPVDGFYQRCLVVALNLFNALDDPDNDGCVNGCEFSGGSGSGSPIDNTDVADSTDTDGDGLDDLTERTLGTNINDPDTDGDGLSDGDEVNVYDTDPRLVDTDDDGLDDDEEVEYCDIRYGVGVSCPGTDPQPDPRDNDTDNDGLIDGIEVEGFNIENLTINGVTSTYLGITTLPGVNDTDNDGIRDGDEVNGYTAQDGTTNIRTLPNNPDTDGDLLCDGPGNGGSTPVTCERLGGVVEEDINPTTIDTDGDLLNDFQEQITFDTDPNNINTDGESCTSASGETGLFLDDFEELAGDMTENINIFTGPNTEDPDNDGVANYYDPDGDTVNNARDEDSDGDGLTDCEEVFIYGTNPYDIDTDGDANGNTDYYDVGEINNICTLPNNPDTDGDGIEDGIDPNYDEQPGEEPCDLSATSESTDGDSLPDAWEQLYYPSSGSPAWDDPLIDDDYDDDADPTNPGPDNCDLLCEYNQGTNPLRVDTDGDGIRDGYEVNSIPTDIDSDNDGLDDGREGAIGTTCVDSTYPNPAQGATAHDTRCWATNPRLTDSDNDGLLDGTEADSDSKPLYDYVTANTTPGYDGTLTYTATDPTLQDTDLDGISDFREVTAGGYNVGGTVYCAGIFMNPIAEDSDSDGLTDSFECRPTGPQLVTCRHFTEIRNAI